LIAALTSCDFETTVFGDFNSPNDPRTAGYADYTIEVLAGIGSGASPETGSASTLRLSNVTDMEASGGYLYVADSLHHRVIRIDETTGASTVIAGTGVPGYSGDGGPATAARLFVPTAVSVDDDGSLLILDAMNNAVRRISAAGIISTYADLAALTGETADLWMQRDWNRGSIARLGTDILVYHYHRIFRLSGSAGSIAATEYPSQDSITSIGDPNSFAVDGNGTLWISAWMHESQQRVLGRVTSGSTTFESLYAFANGALDSIDFDPDGRVIVYKDETTIAAYNPSNGSMTDLTNFKGGPIFCLNDAGLLYRFTAWFDSGRNIITKTTSPTVFAGIENPPASGDAGDRIQPWHLALDEVSSKLYYSDANYNVIRSINLSTGSGTIEASGLPGSPKGVAIGPDREVVFSTFGGSGVYELDGASYTEVKALDHPIEDVAEAPNGAVFAASFTSSTAGVVSYYTGLVERVSGENSILRLGNGTPIAYSDPDGDYATGTPIGAVWAICFGPDGTLYAAEEEGRILAVAPTGIVTRFAGGIWTETSPGRVWFDTFTIDDEFSKASDAPIHTSPRQLAYGADGCLYIANESNVLLRVNADGKIEQMRFLLDGRTVDLCASGLAVDPAGNLYLATSYQIIKASSRL